MSDPNHMTLKGSKRRTRQQKKNVEHDAGIVYLYKTPLERVFEDLHPFHRHRVALEEVLDKVRNIEPETFKKELLGIPYIHVRSVPYFLPSDVEELVLRINRERSINPEQLYSEYEVDEWWLSNRDRIPECYWPSAPYKLSSSCIPTTSSGMYLGKDVLDVFQRLLNLSKNPQPDLTSLSNEPDPEWEKQLKALGRRIYCRLELSKLLDKS